MGRVAAEEYCRTTAQKKGKERSELIEHSCHPQNQLLSFHLSLQERNRLWNLVGALSHTVSSDPFQVRKLAFCGMILNHTPQLSKE